MTRQVQAVAVEAQELFLWLDANAVAHNSTMENPGRRNVGSSLPKLCAVTP